MNIITVIVDDSDDPVEVQTWFDNHSSVTIKTVFCAGKTFYIIYS